MTPAVGAHRESGQAAVETAIVMPLFVFILLGLFQLMLMHQARLMTKYAAYKAVRTGAIYQADNQKMRDAALAVLLPIVGDPDIDRFYGTRDDAMYEASWGTLRGDMTKPLRPLVLDVTVCGPLKSHLNGPSAVEFDDPNADGVGRFGWAGDQFDRTKLSVQVTLYYRLVIPFANGVLWWMVYGKEDPGLIRVLRTGTRDRRTVMAANGTAPEKSKLYNPREDGSTDRTVERLLDLANRRRYALPIRANYVMRMHSTPLMANLPEKNFCIVPWAKSE